MIRKSTVIKILQAIISDGSIRRSQVYRIAGHNTQAAQVSRLLVEPFPRGLLGLAVEVKVGGALKWFATPMGLSFNPDRDTPPVRPTQFEPLDGRLYRLKRARHERNSERRIKASKRAREKGINPECYNEYFEADLTMNEVSRLPTIQRIQWLRSRVGLNS
jgi:hypothetical protein